jgi:hypothetical protein
MILEFTKGYSYVNFHLFQDKEVPGEPLTPKDFENAENLGKQQMHFSKRLIMKTLAVTANFHWPQIDEWRLNGFNLQAPFCNQYTS